MCNFICYLYFRAVFKGGRDEEAVLCTSKETFAVKDVQTSNLVMLVSNAGVGRSLDIGDDGTIANTIHEPVDGYDGRATQQVMLEGAKRGDAVTVTALVNAHLEVNRVPGRLHHLDTLMMEEFIIQDVGGQEDIECVGGKTWDELVSEIQASPYELSEALEDVNAVRIHGKWKGLSQEAHSTFFRLLLLTAAENGWDVGRIPGGEMACKLESHGIPVQLTLQLLHRASFDPRDPASNSSSVANVEDLDRQDAESTGATYSLCAEHVCRHVGLGLLLEKEQWDNVDTFIEAWKSRLPEGMDPKLDVLEGEALFGKGQKQKMNSDQVSSIRRLSAKSLSRDPEERFSQLFSIQNEWTYQQMFPYISKLAGPGQTVEEVLLKYARACQTNPDDDVTYTHRTLKT